MTIVLKEARGTQVDIPNPTDPSTWHSYTQNAGPGVYEMPYVILFLEGSPNDPPGTEGLRAIAKDIEFTPDVTHHLNIAYVGDMQRIENEWSSQVNIPSKHGPRRGLQGEIGVGTNNKVVVLNADLASGVTMSLRIPVQSFRRGISAQLESYVIDPSKPFGSRQARTLIPNSQASGALINIP